MTEQQTERDLRHQFIAGSLEQDNVPERYGTKYPDYLRLVTEGIDYTDLPISQKGENPLVMQDIKREARELGFTSQEVVGMKKRTVGLYARWLAYKHSLQAEQLVGRRFSVRGGVDPHFALGDGSHPHGLGYIQSQRE